MKLWGHSNGDNLKNRRNLAFCSALFAMVIWPHELLILHMKYGLDIDLIKALLLYIGTVASGSIGGYIWSALKTDIIGKLNVGNASKKS